MRNIFNILLYLFTNYDYHKLSGVRFPLYRKKRSYLKRANAVTVCSGPVSSAALYFFSFSCADPKPDAMKL